MLTFARHRASALAEGTLLALIFVFLGAMSGIGVPRGLAAASYTTPEGATITIDSATWTGSADDIYRILLENGMDSVVGPTLKVRVQDVYASSTSTSVFCCTSTGASSNFSATIWLDGRSTSNFTSRPDYVIAHELGHAWTLYHLYMDQSADWTSYLSFRGILGEPRLDSAYSWTKREMIADDYRMVMGSALAKAEASYINPDVPPPSAFPGFADWFTKTWAMGNIGTVLSPTPLTGNPTPSPTPSPAPSPMATATPTTAPAPTPSPTSVPSPSESATPTATATPEPAVTPAPSPVPTLAPSSSPTPSDAITNVVASPQRFKKSTSVGYTVSTSAQMIVVVLDSNGSVVKTLMSGAVTGGAHQVGWDRTNNDGFRVRSGTYQVLLQASDAAGTTVSATITVTAK